MVLADQIWMQVRRGFGRPNLDAGASRFWQTASERGHLPKVVSGRWIILPPSHGSAVPPEAHSFLCGHHGDSVFGRRANIRVWILQEFLQSGFRERILAPRFRQ